MPDTRHPHILCRDDTVLVVVDMQEPFLRGIYERGRLLTRVTLLVEIAKVLGVPILATTQNVEGRGAFVPEIGDLLPADVVPVDKMAFSCAGSPLFMDALRAQGRAQIVLCGVETHICVSQTALDLSTHGWQVHVAADAVSSRSLETHKLGMERMRDSGVLPCASEAAVYEWLREAGTPEFRASLRLVK